MEKELIKNAVAIGLISSAYSLVITLLATGIINAIDIYKDKKAKQRKEGKLISLFIFFSYIFLIKSK